MGEKGKMAIFLARKFRFQDNIKKLKQQIPQIFLICMIHFAFSICIWGSLGKGRHPVQLEDLQRPGGIDSY